jgi:nitrate reductase NapE component
MNTGLCVALWLLANLALIGAYDVYAFYFLPADQSVSYWLQSWSKSWPMLAVGIGIVIGHLCWPLQRTHEN